MTILNHQQCNQIFIKLHNVWLSLQVLCATCLRNILRILHNLFRTILSIQLKVFKHWDSFLSHCIECTIRNSQTCEQFCCLLYISRSQLIHNTPTLLPLSLSFFQCSCILLLTSLLCFSLFAFCFQSYCPALVLLHSASDYIALSQSSDILLLASTLSSKNSNRIPLNSYSPLQHLLVQLLNHFLSSTPDPP